MKGIDRDQAVCFMKAKVFCSLAMADNVHGAREDITVGKRK